MDLAGYVIQAQLSLASLRFAKQKLRQAKPKSAQLSSALFCFDPLGQANLRLSGHTLTDKKWFSILPIYINKVPTKQAQLGNICSGL